MTAGDRTIRRVSPLWLCATITAVSAYVSLGFALVSFRGPASRVGSGDRYALVRCVALAVAATAGLTLGDAAWVAAIALAMIIVQAGDAVVGVTIGDRLKTVGPAVTAVVNLAALVWLLAAE